MSKGTYHTVNDYISSFDVSVQAALQELQSCILKAAPDARIMFNYGIPAYALIPEGKRDQQIMMAGYKKHVGLYPHPDVIEHFRRELAEYKTGKGSVQFPVEKQLPADLIVRMVQYRMKQLGIENG
ncbi:MAG: DUF1801 domain-containing protein [Spirochaetales bacterium]|nr:DUF1801 domain-containing protein [Spirochaetales bacterium]